MGVIDNIREQVNKNFDLSELNKLNRPVLVTSGDFLLPKDLRINHFMVKANVDSNPCLDGLPDSIKNYISICVEYSKKNDLPVDNRYWYLTVDQGLVKSGDTLRTGGWHIDGLQGDEVGIKCHADFQFIWSDKLPTKFALQKFNTEKLDLSKHNIFKKLGSQVKPSNVVPVPDKLITLMTPYHVHIASEAEEDTYRNFIRLSFTHTPITSVKMTINPNMSYNYPIHTTSGEIPSYLK